VQWPCQWPHKRPCGGPPFKLFKGPRGQVTAFGRASGCQRGRSRGPSFKLFWRSLGRPNAKVACPASFKALAAPRDGPSKQSLETVPRDGASTRPSGWHLETAPRNGALRRSLDKALSPASRNGPSVRRPVRDGPSRDGLRKSPSKGPLETVLRDDLRRPLEKAFWNGAFGRPLDEAPRA